MAGIWDLVNNVTNQYNSSTFKLIGNLKPPSTCKKKYNLKWVIQQYNTIEIQHNSNCCVHDIQAANNPFRLVYPQLELLKAICS